MENYLMYADAKIERTARMFVSSSVFSLVPKDEVTTKLNSWISHVTEGTIKNVLDETWTERESSSFGLKASYTVEVRALDKKNLEESDFIVDVFKAEYTALIHHKKY